MKINTVMNALIFAFYCSVLQHLPTAESGYDRTTASPTSNQSVDPNFSLEGSCVMVCDSSTLKPLNQARKVSRQNRRTSLSRRIAFSFSKKDNSNNDISKTFPNIIKFDYQILNSGNCFDISESTFIAPSNGVYSFDFTIVKENNPNSLTVTLTENSHNNISIQTHPKYIFSKVNGNSVLTAFADGSLARHEMAHNSGIVHLEKDSKVRIEILNGALDEGWSHSTFSGYLLYEDQY